MKLLKYFSALIGLRQDNLSLRGKEFCQHLLLVWYNRGYICGVNSHILDWHM